MPEALSEPNRTSLRDYSSLALLAATLISLLPFCAGGLIWDDALFVEHNNIFSSQHPLTDALSRSFFASAEGPTHSDSADIGRYYRPVVSLWYWCLHQLFGAQLGLWHLALIIVHLCAVALVVKLARALFSGDPLAVTITAGAFALHASRWLSVGWLSGCPDPLMALSSLGVLVIAARALATPTWSAGAKIAALGAIALLTKETAVALAPSVALLTLTASPPGSRRAALARLALPFGALTLGWLAMRALWLPVGAGASIPLGAHSRAVMATLGVYLRTVAWPLPTTALRSVGSLYVFGEPELPAGWVVIGALGSLGLALAFAINLRKRPLVSLGVGLWVLWLLPVSNLVWTSLPSLASDRFLYLPMLGAGAALAALCASLNGPARRAAFALATGLLLGHSVLLALSSRHLHDEPGFWQRELAINPDSAVAATHRAAWLDAHGAPAAAFTVRFAPLALAMRRRPELATSQCLEALMSLTRFCPDDHPCMAQALSALDATEARAMAVHHWVLGFEFSFVPAREPSLGAVARALRLSVAADLASRIGEAAGARERVERAVALCPTCSEPKVLFALIAAREGRWEAAQTAITEASRAAPDAAGVTRTIAAARALTERAVALRAMGNATGAAGREAEALVLLGAPELARARVAHFALTPATRIARARIELSEWHFARAEALVEALRREPSALVRQSLSELDGLASVQRTRVRGFEGRTPME